MAQPEENKTERPTLIKTLSRSLQRVPTGGDRRRSSDEKDAARDSVSPRGEARKHIPQGRGGAGMQFSVPAFKALRLHCLTEDKNQANELKATLPTTHLP